MDVTIIVAIISAATAILIAAIGYIVSRRRSLERLRIFDILVEQKTEGACIIDFRVVNRSDFDVSISRIRLKCFDFEVIPTLEHRDYTMSYGTDLSSVNAKAQFLEVPVSQVIKSHATDRFSVTLIARLGIGECRYWKFRPFVIS